MTVCSLPGWSRELTTEGEVSHSHSRWIVTHHQRHDKRCKIQLPVNCKSPNDTLVNFIQPDASGCKRKESRKLKASRKEKNDLWASLESEIDKFIMTKPYKYAGFCRRPRPERKIDEHTSSTWISCVLLNIIGGKNQPRVIWRKDTTKR